MTPHMQREITTQPQSYMLFTQSWLAQGANRDMNSDWATDTLSTTPVPAGVHALVMHRQGQAQSPCSSSTHTHTHTHKSYSQSRAQDSWQPTCAYTCSKQAPQKHLIMRSRNGRRGPLTRRNPTPPYKKAEHICTGTVFHCTCMSLPFEGHAKASQRQFKGAHTAHGVGLHADTPDSTGAVRAAPCMR